MKTGVVLFDDPNIPSQAWAARAGERAFRIASVEALSSDTIWMLSLDAQQMYAFGLSGHAIFRGSDYLRLRLDAIADEIMPARVGNSERAQVLATIFERVVLLYQRFFEPDVPRERWEPHPFSMRHAIREALLPYDPDLRAHPDLYKACTESLQEFVRCAVYVDRNKGMVTVPVALPRIAHAREVLSCEVPLSLANRRIGGPYPKNGDLQVQWVAKEGLPMLCQVTVHSVSEEFAGVLSYGGVTSSRPRVMGARGTNHRATRSWMTSNELLWLAPIARIEIHDCFVFEEAGSLMRLPVLGSFFSTVTQADEAGISVPLFAELLWTGVTTAHAHPVKKMTSANIVAPFIRAQERFLCFRKAKRFFDEGYQISGYGAGRIFLVFEEDEFLPANAFRAAAVAGCLPPMLDPQYPHRAMLMDDIGANASEAYRAVMGVLASGQWQAWMQFDDALIDRIMKKE